MQDNVLKKLNFTFKIPVWGIGCGVLGLSLAKVSVKLGDWSAILLKALEYRGYDSTGAVFQDSKHQIRLMKDVGAPSILVKTLGIEKEQGKIFCGQVRWATFGDVNQRNAQPHWVKCKTEIYGAHNGNITNTHELKQFLLSEGHNVVSDNDGEMLVHTVEHYFDNELKRQSKETLKQTAFRRECMYKALVQASEKMVGSYAAVIVDPFTEYSYAIKAGSSLYFGIGEIEGNRFGLASSDLTAVLKFTKVLVNMREGEFIEFKDEHYQVFAFRDVKVKRPNLPDLNFSAGDKIAKEPVISRLRAEDTELIKPYKYFMEQEIHAEVDTTGKLVKLFQGGSNTCHYMLDFIHSITLYDELNELRHSIVNEEMPQAQLKLFNDYVFSVKGEYFFTQAQKMYPRIYAELFKEKFDRKYFFSYDKNIFLELMGSDYNKSKQLLAKALDSITEEMDVHNFDSQVNSFLNLMENTISNNGKIYTIACGTSFHATKVASLFFNEIACQAIIPVLPGDFRGQYSSSLRDNDVIIGVSQSGETKDLIDIFNDVEASGKNVKLVVLVNNVNSTLGQEKSDVCIPIYCGPEMAVPATKSFMNQIMLFYYLAIKTALMKFDKVPDKMNGVVKENIEKRLNSIHKIPLLLDETIQTTADQIEYVAGKAYMEPSMHILATKLTGVAKEGALKIRETVLNHTEGGEASEFKHGPNTILGKNTIYGIKNVRALVKDMNQNLFQLHRKAQAKNISPEEVMKINSDIETYIFQRIFPFDLTKDGTNMFEQHVKDYDFFQKIYRNYPLLYITGPDQRDINLTISQINTHKIRGADTFVIAEENDDLLNNAMTNPHDKGYYGWGYIPLPKTGDTMMTIFSASVVLQLLALKMSIKKMAYLDRIGIIGHGVHPDVPKNVSKSITVD
ncbi:MAG: SIS domain-containing protein [Candidatus Cloacimonetes bacterium]|nr:SIS domain-containing protein [Candidatus Cloacimonadota bacterium]